MSKMTKAKKRRAADAREALIKAALYVLRGHGVPLWCDEIVALMARYDQGPTTARRLSAALRVARKDGRVTYDGAKYGLPKMLPLTGVQVAAPAVVALDAAKAVHANPLPTKEEMREWIRWEDKAMDRGGDRERAIIVRYLRARGDVTDIKLADAIERGEHTRDDAPTWGSAAVPAWVQQDAAVLGIGEQEGKAGRLRRIGAGQWSVVDARGAPIWIGNPEFIAARWEPVGETHPAPAPGAARDLAERQAFGGAGIRTPSLTPQDVAAAGARAPVPTEAAERIAALEARAANYAATIVELTMRLIASEKARAA